MSGSIDTNRTSNRFGPTSTSHDIAGHATSNCIASSVIGVPSTSTSHRHRNDSTSHDIVSHASSHRYRIACLLPVTSPEHPVTSDTSTHHTSTSHRHRMRCPAEHADIASASHRRCQQMTSHRHRIASHRVGIDIASHRHILCHVYARAQK